MGRKIKYLDNHALKIHYQFRIVPPVLDYLCLKENIYDSELSYLYLRAHNSKL